MDDVIFVDIKLMIKEARTKMKPELIEVPREKLGSKDKVKRTEYCKIGGINLRIFVWLKENDEISSKILGEGINCYDIALMMGVENEYDRIILSKKILYNLWDKDNKFGPKPILYYLDKFQSKGHFYSEYRDHLKHSLLVYLLGVFVYFNCAEVRNKIDSAIIKSFSKDGNAEDTFISIWKIISIYHDVGYIFESEIGDSSESKNEKNEFGNIAKEITDRIMYPLSKIEISYTEKGKTKKTKISYEDETEWYEKHERPNPRSIKEVDDIGVIFVEGKEKDLLRDLDEFAHVIDLVGINAPDDSIGFYRELFKVLHDKAPIYRKRYWDHGIASAALLMHIYEEFIATITWCVKNQGKGNIHNKYNFNTIIENQEENRNIVKIAAMAIATHNIDPKVIHKDGKMGEKIINGVKTSLKKANLNQELKILTSFFIESDNCILDSGEIFSFYLKVIDSIQDYGRSLFRARNSDDMAKLLYDSDIDISFDKNKIYLYIDRDDSSLGAAGGKALFAKIMNEIKSTSNNDDVDKLLSSDKNLYKKNALPSKLTKDNIDGLNKLGKEKIKKGKKGNGEGEFNWDICNDYIFLDKIKNLIGKDVIDEKIQYLDVFKNIGLTKCQVSGDKECPYHLQALQIISELKRCNTFVYESSRIIEYIKMIKDCANKLYSQLTPIKHNGNKDKLELVRGLNNSIIGLAKILSSFDRDYEDEEIDFCKKEGNNDIYCLKGRLLPIIYNRTIPQLNENVDNFVNSILFMSEELPKILLIHSSWKSFTKYLSGPQVYNKFIQKLGYILEKGKDEIKLEQVMHITIKRLIADLNEDLDMLKNKFKNVKYSYLVSGEEINLQHLMQPNNFVIWKRK